MFSREMQGLREFLDFGTSDFCALRFRLNAAIRSVYLRFGVPKCDNTLRNQSYLSSPFRITCRVHQITSLAGLCIHSRQAPLKVASNVYSYWYYERMTRSRISKCISSETIRHIHHLNNLFRCKCKAHHT